MNTYALPEATRSVSPEAVEALSHDALHAALSAATRERLAYLFRDTLQQGRIHPLYLPMLRFRYAQEQA